MRLAGGLWSLLLVGVALNLVSALNLIGVALNLVDLTLSRSCSSLSISHSLTSQSLIVSHLRLSPSHSLPRKTLIGSLILPEIPLSGKSIEPSLTDTTCNIYSLDSQDAVVVSVQCSVSPERSHSVAKLLIGDRIVPKRVVILDSLRSQNYRGRLSLDDQAFAFKLETAAPVERKIGVDEKFLKGLEYYPSGSVVNGLSAALMGQCQIQKIRGVLCISWPEFDASVVSLVKGLVQRDVLPGLDINLSDEKGDVLPLKFGPRKDHLSQFDFYA